VKILPLKSSFQILILLLKTNGGGINDFVVVMDSCYMCLVSIWYMVAQCKKKKISNCLSLELTKTDTIRQQC